MAGESGMTTLVIGGGWSGLAAAVSLIRQGHAVHLVESAKQVGGRARNVTWQGKMVDNEIGRASCRERV